MIKFFRHIRKSLINQNLMGKPTSAKASAGKYFKYAIGEILLVVIGILIALQINNSNEHLKQLKQEQDILKNLKQDFEYNRDAVKSVLNSNARNINSAKLALNHTGSRFSTHFDIDPILGDIASSVYYYPKNGVLSDVINSGNLGIIRNSELRSLLTSWAPRLDDLNRRQDANKEFENQIIRYIINKGSWLNSDELTDDETIKRLNFPSSGFRVDNNELLKNIEFENMIENQAVFLEIMNERLQLCLQLNEQILELLYSETNTND